MSGRLIASRRFITLVLPIYAILLADTGGLAAQSYSASDGAIIQPATCRGTWAWYYWGAFDQYEKDGRLFDANPFTLVRWLTRSDAIYQSSRGRRLPDVSGKWIWTDARVRAECWERIIPDLLGGRIHTVFNTITLEFGEVVSRSTACGTGDEFTGSTGDFSSASYDPYGSEEGCDPDGGGLDGGGNRAGCTQQYVVMEVSNDGGATWSTYWEGYATVCT